MFKRSLLIFVLMLGTSVLFAQQDLTKYVNPFIGTGGHGHTYPGASLPFGTVQLSPDARMQGWDWCSGYHVSDKNIKGFSHTHLSGTGASDYGDILFMPYTGRVKFNPGSIENPDEGYRSRISHDKEFASPGYYGVMLDDYNIKAELTVTQRVGFHKYTFPKSNRSNIIIDLEHGIHDKTTESFIKLINPTTVQGYRRSGGWARDHTVYFVAEFSKPFRKSITTANDLVLEGVEATGRNLKTVLTYDTNEGEEILVRVGISHVSIEGARNNLKTELQDFDFERVKKEAEDVWNKKLNKIEITDASEDNKEIYYTALYHSLLNPNVFSDADGSYTGMDGKVYNSKTSTMHTVFSLWDTFRATHPLFTIIEVEKTKDLINTMLAKYDESGLLPVWELAANETGTMIGYHSIPVIVDAYIKGIRGFDVEKAFEAMKASAATNIEGLNYYRDLGYIPAEYEHGSVSKTLEYAYDDWCIAQMAKALGKDEDYKVFINRAKFYVNVYDKESGFMRGKRNGNWVTPFDPYSVSGDYTEANAFQYTFFVPQDVSGLIKLMGGKESFIKRIDNLFTETPELSGKFQPDITGLIGQYAHGNEPSHHMAYLYNYAGAPWKTQEKMDEIFNTMYSTKPDGLSGNEDCGQMSSWYNLSALGFYPVCPGDNKYIIGKPNFSDVKINLENGKTFHITANNISKKNIYISSVQLNGKELHKTFIKHADIMNGGKLVFNMTDKPNKEYGSKEINQPVSKIDLEMVSVPVIKSKTKSFVGSLEVELISYDGYNIYYTLDGTVPTNNSILYDGTITIEDDAVIYAKAYKNATVSSYPVKAEFRKRNSNLSIEIKSKYAKKYSAGGDNALIDRIVGTESFLTGAWQGYQETDFEAIVDLGAEKEISNVAINFIQDYGSWIFFPKEVEFFVSSDNEKFNSVGKIINDIPLNKPGGIIQSFNKDVNDVDARYVKVIAKNIGTCPPWHKGAGGKAWIFTDEITIKTN